VKHICGLPPPLLSSLVSFFYKGTPSCPIFGRSLDRSRTYCKTSSYCVFVPFFSPAPCGVSCPKTRLLPNPILPNAPPNDHSARVQQSKDLLLSKFLFNLPDPRLSFQISAVFFPFSTRILRWRPAFSFASPPSSSLCLLTGGTFPLNHGRSRRPCQLNLFSGPREGNGRTFGFSRNFLIVRGRPLS